MKQFKLSLYLVSSLTVILFSCAKSTNDSQALLDQPTGNSVFNQIDSVKVDYAGKLTFIDYSELHQLYLFLSSSQELLLIEGGGDVVRSLDLIGDSPDKCGRRINHATFDDDGNIVIASERAFNFFDLEGKKVRDDITPDFDMIYVGVDKRMQIVEVDRREMAVLEPKSPYVNFDPTAFDHENIKAYFKQHKSRTLYDLEKNKVHSRNFGNEEGSIHLEFDYRYRDKGYRLFYDKGENKYYMINNPEHVIYKYGLNGTEYVLEDRIRLSPDHFRYVKKYELTEFRPESIDEALKYNSNYLSLVTSEDKIYVFYRQGIVETPEEVTIQEAIARSDNYLMVLDNEGNKLSEDILLPKDFRDLFYVDESEHLYFYPKQERADYELFYKVRFDQ